MSHPWMAWSSEKALISRICCYIILSITVLGLLVGPNLLVAYAVNDRLDAGYQVYVDNNTVTDFTYHWYDSFKYETMDIDDANNIVSFSRE